MYAEFEEQLITLKIENRTVNGRDPDNELDLQLRLRRFEKLAFTVSSHFEYLCYLLFSS